MSRIMDKQVRYNRSNMDIAVITMAILRIHYDDLPQAVLCLSAISENPMAVTRDYIRNHMPQWELFAMMGAVDQLVDVYTRPQDPERFWRNLSYKFESSWPEVLNADPVLFTKEQADRLSEVADVVWNVIECSGTVQGVPRRRPVHSRETLASIRRSFWAFELHCRSSVLNILGFNTGPWDADEIIGSGVTRFLRLCAHVLQQTARVNNGTSIEEMLVNDLNLWNKCWWVGLRGWHRIASLNRETACVSIAFILRAMANYIPAYYNQIWGRSAFWYYLVPEEMAFWHIKRLPFGTEPDVDLLNNAGGLFERVDDRDVEYTFPRPG